MILGGVQPEGYVYISMNQGDVICVGCIHRTQPRDFPYDQLPVCVTSVSKSTDVTLDDVPVSVTCLSA
jgi:hypothetical protein